MTAWDALHYWLPWWLFWPVFALAGVFFFFHWLENGKPLSRSDKIAAVILAVLLCAWAGLWFFS